MSTTSGPILIVDDEDDARASLRLVLEAEGYSVLEAKDGNAALRVLVASGATEPALIILDLVMPGMTGWEFLVIVRSYVRLTSIPVIVVSGRSPALLTLERGLVSHFFQKPPEISLLLDAVRKHVEPHGDRVT